MRNDTATLYRVGGKTDGFQFSSLRLLRSFLSGRRMRIRGYVGRTILIDGTAAGVLLLVWYAGFIYYNRRRGGAVLQWIQAACLGKGRILNPHWQASSCLLKATLHLSSRWFEDARLTIRLLPRPIPVSWFLSRWRKQEETLIFEADMGFPPGFHMDVFRHSWSGQTSVRTSAKAPKTRNWSVTRTAPVVLTTKEDWPAELSALVNALTSWRDKDFLSVRFNPTSPHFTATVALQNLSDQDAVAGLLGLFRELAASSSAKQH